MKRGIDVSVYNGDIDWSKVCADGIDFAMIKATQGRAVTGNYRDFTDSKFAANITGAHSNGIRCGVYHYLTAQSVAEAIHEAEYYLSVIEPYRSRITLYAAVDVEEDMYLPQDKKLLTQIVHAFCSRVRSAGYDPIIYTNQNYMTYRLGDVSMWPLWLALWRDKNNVPSAEKYPNLRIWQWGSETVDGITGRTDGDFMIAEKPVEEHIDDVDKKVYEKKADTSESPSAWAADAFAWTKENGILLGDGNGKYRPHDPLTREEACLIAKRICDAAAKCAADAIDDEMNDFAKRIAKALGLK